MRIEIHRWLMAIPPRDDGRVAAAYDILVPFEDCPPKADGVIHVRLDANTRKEYRHYPDATWATDLSPGWERSQAWIAHERSAKRRMLAFLHRHCPETRELTEWPSLWAYIRPELAEGLHTVFFTIAAPGAPTAAPGPDVPAAA